MIFCQTVTAQTFYFSVPIFGKTTWAALTLYVCKKINIEVEASEKKKRKKEKQNIEVEVANMQCMF